MTRYPPWFVVPPETSVKHRLMILEDLVRLGAMDPMVAALTGATLAGAASDTYAVLAALLRELHDRVRYTLSPQGGQVQLLQRAEYTLFDRRLGDCVCMSVAYASMVQCAGLPARAVWIEQAEDLPNNHVSAQVCARAEHEYARDYGVQVFSADEGPTCPLPNTWMWVETTLPGARPGEHPYAAAERLGVIRPELASPGRLAG